MQSQKSWAASIVLREAEWIVRGWKGSSQTKIEILRDEGHGWSTQSRYSINDLKKLRSGVLVLTNQRLLWLQKNGIISPSYDLSFDIPLEQVMGISAGGILFRHATITDGNGTHWFHLGGQTLGRRGKGFPLFKRMILFQQEQVLKR